MATFRSAEMSLAFRAAQTGQIGIANPVVEPRVLVNHVFSPGVSALGEIDLGGSVEVAIEASPVVIDLKGGVLVDGSKDPIDPADVVGFALKAHDTNVDDVTFNTTVANGWTGAIDGTGTLPPGGFAAFGYRGGFAITDGTNDLIEFSGTNVGDKVDVLLLGRSAILP